MSRANQLLICLLLLALVFLFLSLPYLVPPDYVSECNKAGGLREECIGSLACIKHDAKLCEYLGSPSHCIEDVGRTRDTYSWELQKEVRDQSGYPDSEIRGHKSRCAAFGLWEKSISYSNDYLGHSISYSIPFFAEGCIDSLQDEEMELCEEIYNETMDEYFRFQCAKNINLAKNSPLEETCQGDRDCEDEYARYHRDLSACREGGECRIFFAIEEDMPDLCEGLSGYAEPRCFTYFAIKEQDVGYCDRIQSSEDRQHYCRALILAMQSSN